MRFEAARVCRKARTPHKLLSASSAILLFSSCRLAHSCPFRHNFVLHGA